MMNYPRPQLKRKNWTSLDGEWTVNGEKTIVPGCLQSEKMHFEKVFHYEKDSKRVLLHFGAVDQVAKVYLNGQFLGEHKGGYLPFSFEVTDVVKTENLLTVEVEDTLDHTYPYGKQKKKRGGMWYTLVSGIWKSVWLEGVPREYIKSVKIRPDLRGVRVEETIVTDDGEIMIAERFDEKAPILWTLNFPHLYTRTLTYKEDEVEIYYALRTLEMKEVNGVNRICLNGTPIFLHGVLDQGYFGKGLFVPADPSEYEKEVLRMKELGFNLLRKHIKVEPEAFYYACDKYGMLVMQDMVNNGDYHFFRDTVLGTLGVQLKDQVDSLDERMRIFIEHSKETVRLLQNHPSVIAYTIFNEGWGQFNSDELYDTLKAVDNTRFYDSTSGWFKQTKSDFDSEHIYFRLKELKPQKRPLLVSECGGYSFNIGRKKKTYGYGACHSVAELTGRIEKLYQKMILPAISKGCCGCIYTQVSDIEDEINGLYNEDRTVCKVDAGRMRKLAKKINESMKG